MIEPRWQCRRRCYDDNRPKFYYPGGAPLEEVGLAQVVVGRWGRSTRRGLRAPPADTTEVGVPADPSWCALCDR